jgi:hypothetical protein
VPRLALGRVLGSLAHVGPGHVERVEDREQRAHQLLGGALELRRLIAEHWTQRLP